MKNSNYHLYLTDDEYSQVIHSLIELKTILYKQVNIQMLLTTCLFV